MSTISPQEQQERAGSFPAGLTYVAYAAHRVSAPLAGQDRAALAAEAQAALEGAGVTVRGAYDTSGYRAECDLLLWLCGPSPEAVQDAMAALRRSALGALLAPFWTSIGVHREAEFNKGHIPAYFAGEDPKDYVCVYPFVRTLDWYLLEPGLRSRLLAEHGRMAVGYPDVRANTVSAFGLGDYEWLLAFEADDLVRIVDLIRHLRGAEARRYTKHELPFITGVRRPLADILAALP